VEERVGEGESKWRRERERVEESVRGREKGGERVEERRGGRGWKRETTPSVYAQTNSNCPIAALLR
jgi:hypothetical protein